MTLVSIGLLEAVSPLAGLGARGGGLSEMHAEETLLAVLCLAIAAFSGFRLTRKNITPGLRGMHTFLLLLAITIVAMVRFTMYSWSHFGS